jgi:phosphatidylglycerophosphatase A
MSTSHDAPPPARGPLSLLAYAVATGLGSGYSPIVPGTAGSALGLLLFWPLSAAPSGVQVAAVIALFLVGVAAGAHVARRSGVEDPSIVVVDEVVGQWITLLFLPLTPLTAAAGFVLFRVMDVIKPWPARRFEHLHGGWGIMADDVMAGVYANLALRVLLLAVSGA